MELTIQDILEDLHTAENKHQEFEKKYGILSEYFYAAYINRLFEDNGNPDFAEWSGCYKSKLDRENRFRAILLQDSQILQKLKNIIS